jgi:hypothetical protein
VLLLLQLLASAAAASAASGLIFQRQANSYSMAGKDGPTKVLLSEDEMPKRW